MQTLCAMNPSITFSFMQQSRRTSPHHTVRLELHLLQLARLAQFLTSASSNKPPVRMAEDRKVHGDAYASQATATDTAGAPTDQFPHEHFQSPMDGSMLGGRRSPFGNICVRESNQGNR